eukprot:scaffold28084_cov59-Phaeocystis_antarctica.AAC.2
MPSGDASAVSGVKSDATVAAVVGMCRARCGCDRPGCSAAIRGGTGGVRRNRVKARTCGTCSTGLCEKVRGRGSGSRGARAVRAAIAECGTLLLKQGSMRFSEPPWSQVAPHPTWHGNNESATGFGWSWGSMRRPTAALRRTQLTMLRLRPRRQSLPPLPSALQHYPGTAGRQCRCAGDALAVSATVLVDRPDALAEPAEEPVREEHHRHEDDPVAA